MGRKKTYARKLPARREFVFIYVYFINALTTDLLQVDFVMTQKCTSIGKVLVQEMQTLLMLLPLNTTFRSFKFASAEVRNNIPSPIQNSSSIDVYKCFYKKLYCNQFYFLKVSSFYVQFCFPFSLFFPSYVVLRLLFM